MMREVHRRASISGRILPVSAHLICVGILLMAGCAKPPRWAGREKPTAADAAVLLESRAGENARALLQDEVPKIPIRKRLRPCCAFGNDLKVRVGAVPIPGFRIGNIIGPDEVGPHTYDSGAMTRSSQAGTSGFRHREGNGLLYTCRGGFIDTAHLREPVDWIAFFLPQLDRHLEKGMVVELPVEGADRRIIFEPISEELIRRNGRDEIIIAISQWIAYELSIWHEIVQWYGVSMLQAFNETASGFSLEDAYSNAVGLRMMDGIDFRKHLVSEVAYNRFIDELLVEGIKAFDPVPQEVGDTALTLLDKIWWDSNVRLPNLEVVRRRYLDIGMELSPWLFPDKFATPEFRAQLKEACGSNPEPLTIQIPDSLEGFAFKDYVTLEFTLNGSLEGIPVFEALGPRFDQEAFPEVMAAASLDVREKLGPRAHLPD